MGQAICGNQIHCMNHFDRRAREYARQFITMDLVLESSSADDPSLPKPRGRTDHKRPVDKQETHKLEATKKLGGLIPDRTGEQYWQCAECSAIYDNCMQAKACCGSEANRVQICQNCRKRIADCTCPSPMGQQQINGGWVKDSSLEREIICISLRSAIDDFWWQRTEGVPAVILGGQERSR